MGWYSGAMRNPLRLLYAKIFEGKSAITSETLKKWNIAVVLLLAAQAVAIVLLGTAQDVPLRVSFLTTDSLQSRLRGSAVTSPAMHQLSMLNVAYCLAAVFIVLALFRLAFATLFRAQYDQALKREVRGWRWTEYAFGGAALVVLMSVLAGLYDVLGLVLITVLIAIMYAAGYGIELYSRIPKRSRNVPLGALLGAVGIAGGALPLAIIAGTLLATSVYGMAPIPGYLYGLYAIIVVVFAKQVAVTHLVGMKRGKWSSYAYGESWLVALSFVGVSAFAWVVFVGLLHP